MPNEFQGYQGGLLDQSFTSYRDTVSVIPAAFGDFHRNKWDDAYEFTDGTTVFTLYTPQGFSEDPENRTNWNSKLPTQLSIGVSRGAPSNDVARFKAWVQTLSNSYKATP